MATKSHLTLILILITTLLYVGSFVTPWWFTEYEPKSGNNEIRSNCFIDGTCRGGGRVHKDNGDAQGVFDATLILMVVSLLPFNVLVHSLLWRRSKRFETPFLVGRGTILISGIFTFCLILASVLTFAIGIVNKSEFDQLFGEEDINGLKYQWVSWGASWGWFLAIACLIMLIPTILIGMAMKSKSSSGRTRLFADDRKVTAQYVAVESS